MFLFTNHDDHNKDTTKALHVWDTLLPRKWTNCCIRSAHVTRGHISQCSNPNGAHAVSSGWEVGLGSDNSDP